MHHAPFDSVTDLEEIREVLPPDPRFTLNADDIHRRIAGSGALLKGHFQLLSGTHSQYFLRFSWFVQHSGNAAVTAALLREAIVELNWDPTVIVGPQTAGAALALEMANQLNVPNVVVKRGRDGRPSELLTEHTIRTLDRALIVNDVATTGVGVRQMIELATEAGARVLGVSVFAARTEERAIFSVPLSTILRMVNPSQPPNECSLCAAGAGAPVQSFRIN